jgi:hypothetical protein
MPRKKTANPNFIQGAIKHPGALTAKAQSAGVSVDEYAQRVVNNQKGYDPQTFRQASFHLRVLKPVSAKRKGGA